MSDSSSPHDRFDQLISSAPNELTVIIASHHAIELEIHQILEQLLSRSSRLDLRKLPFLTKVDLLVALGVLGDGVFPLFAEVNRLRNRFAHNPNSSLTTDDASKIKNVFGSLPVQLVPDHWKWEGVAKTVETLLHVVFVNVRAAFENIVRQRAESHALDEILRTQFPHIASPKPRTTKTNIDHDVERLAKDYLTLKHPEVKYRE